MDADQFDEWFLYGGASPDQDAFLHQVLDLGLAFMSGEARNGRVLEYRDNGELARLVAQSLPEDASSLPELHTHLERIARYSIAQSDPRYLAFPDTGNSVATIAADVMRSCLNQNLIAVDRSAPIATFIEAQLILWLRQLIGFDTHALDALPNLSELGGMWTSGGNMSNHVCVLAALHRRHPVVRERGLVGLAKKPVIVLARGVEHFSYLGAAQALGLGADALVFAEPSRDFRSDPDALKSALASLPDDVDPIMVVAVAGNCRTTGMDDIDRVADVCERHGVWLHVDACHGGSLLFSERLSTHLRGIHRADSVAIDPHKGLFVGYSCSYALFKDPADLSRFARYPAKVEDPDCYDLGLLTPFYGSRGFDSLKMWLVIRHLGRRGIGAAVEAREQTFRVLVGMLERTELFMLLNDPTFYRVAFVFLPPRLRGLLPLAADRAGEDAVRAVINRYTAAYSRCLYQAGDVTFDEFALQDLDDRLGLGRTAKLTVMGMAVGHPMVPHGTVERVRAALCDAAVGLADAMEHELLAIADDDVVVARRRGTGRMVTTDAPAFRIVFVCHAEIELLDHTIPTNIDALCGHTALPFETVLHIDGSEHAPLEALLARARTWGIDEVCLRRRGRWCAGGDPSNNGHRHSFSTKTPYEVSVEGDVVVVATDNRDALAAMREAFDHAAHVPVATRIDDYDCWVWPLEFRGNLAAAMASVNRLSSHFIAYDTARFDRFTRERPVPWTQFFDVEDTASNYEDWLSHSLARPSGPGLGYFLDVPFRVFHCDRKRTPGSPHYTRDLRVKLDVFAERAGVVMDRPGQ